MPGTTSSDGQHADLVLESSLESVDRAEEIVLSAAREIGFDEDARYQVGIAVRESMVNAVAHGNRYHSGKKVLFQVWTSPERLVVLIGDEGNGFELDKVPDPRDEANLMRHSGRGMLMIRAFMDELEITRREPKGTLIRMVKNFKPA